MDLLTLDKPLTTREALVQLSPELAAGVYLVSLRVVDSAGDEDEAQLSLTLVGDGRTLPGDTRTPPPGPRLPGGVLTPGRPGAAPVAGGTNPLARPAAAPPAATRAAQPAPKPAPRKRPPRKPPT